MEKLKQNTCVKLLCSPTCAICYSVWSFICIVGLITYGLIEGKGKYQKINTSLLDDAHLQYVMNGAFVASFLYGLCILGCLVSFLYSYCRGREPAAHSYQRV